MVNVIWRWALNYLIIFDMLLLSCYIMLGKCQDNEMIDPSQQENTCFIHFNDHVCMFICRFWILREDLSRSAVKTSLTKLSTTKRSFVRFRFFYLQRLKIHFAADLIVPPDFLQSSLCPIFVLKFEFFSYQTNIPLKIWLHGTSFLFLREVNPPLFIVAEMKKEPWAFIS